MADIDMEREGMPPGIPTFKVIYDAIEKLIKRVDNLEERVSKLEQKPAPAKKVVGKTEENKVKK